jgi:hypothetical protein
MASSALIDDNGVPIPHDYRSRVRQVLSSEGYQADDNAIFDINWLINQAKACWDEYHSERRKLLREPTIEKLNDVSKSYQNFCAAWSSLTRDHGAKVVLFNLADSQLEGRVALEQLDAVVEDRIVKTILIGLKSKSAQAAIPPAAPGVVPVDALLPTVTKLLRALQKSLIPTGTVPRTPMPATHSKRCKIATELLDACGVRIASKTIQNHTKGM